MSLSIRVLVYQNIQRNPTPQNSVEDLESITRLRLKKKQTLAQLTVKQFLLMSHQQCYLNLPLKIVIKIL